MGSRSGPSYMQLKRSKEITQAVRFSSLIGRGILVFVVAKFLNAAEYADFLLISSYSALFVILIGFDFTRYIQPLIVKDRVKNSNESLVQLYRFSLFVSLVFFVFVVLALFLTNMKTGFAAMFFAVTVSEYLAQEAGRALTALDEQVVSAFSLFLRAAIPPLLLLSLAIVGASLNLVEIFALITFFSVLSLFYSWTYLFKGDLRKVISFKLPQITWLAVTTSFLFFISTCVVKIFFSVDKSIVHGKYGVDVLAAYGLTLSAAMVIVPIVDVFVGSYALPRFLRLAATNDLNLRNFYHQTLKKTLVLALTFYAVGGGAFYYLSFRIFPNYHINNLLETYFIFLIPVIFSISNTPSQLLVSLRGGFGMAVSSVIAVLAFVGFNFIFRIDFRVFLLSLGLGLIGVLVCRLLQAQIRLSWFENSKIVI